MRQLFKCGRVFLLPLLVLLAVPATGFGQFGRVWEQRFDTIPGMGWWNTIIPMEAEIINGWNSAAAVTSHWHSNSECQDAMGYTLDALANADIQAGIGSFAGEYFGPLTDTSTTNDADVIVISAFAARTPAGLGTLIHEAWHRSTGDTDADIDELNVHLDTMYSGRSLESCHDEAREEDEDDDPECDASADCNGGGETPKPKKVCTEQQVYVRWTVWVFKWEVIGFEWAKAYDPLAGDGETREQALELVPIYRTWFEQEQRGEWRTETVCTTVSS